MIRKRKKPDPALLADAEVMKRVREGDTEVFSVIIRRYQNSLLNFFRRLGVYTDAEDMVQECFLRIFRNRMNYRETARFTTFLYRVGRNVWIDWVRRQARRSSFLTEYEDEMPALNEYRERPTGGGMDAQTALESLPEKLRLAVVMSIYQGMKYAEIAEALDIPVGTVKSRISTAFDLLRDFMYADAGKRSS